MCAPHKPMEKETSSQSIIQPTKPQILRLSHQLLPKPTSAQKLNPTQPGDAKSTETDRITPHSLEVPQPLGSLPLQSAKQTRLGASNHRVKQDFEPPDANFPYDSRCEHADARKGSKNASNRMRNRCLGGGEGSSWFSLSLLPRRMHFGKGGSPEREG